MLMMYIYSINNSATIVSLCISYKHFNRRDYDQSFIIADTRLSVIARVNSSESAVHLLPSSTKIAHINDSGIKVYIIKNKNKYLQRDIVIAIAGAVSLGLQSVIYLETTLLGLMGNQKFDQTIKLIEGVIQKFWETAYDKDIEYLITLADDDNKTRIYRKIGEGNTLHKIEEVTPEHGVVIGVIGDKSFEIKKRIFGEINKICIINPQIPIEAIVEACCVRALRAEIENDDNSLVGGYIQSAAMKGREGYYMTSHYKGGVSFRGVFYGETLNLEEFPAKYPMWPFGDDLYNPITSIEDIARILSKMYQ